MFSHIEKFFVVRDLILKLHKIKISLLYKIYLSLKIIFMSRLPRNVYPKENLDPSVFFFFFVSREVYKIKSFALYHAYFKVF